MEWPQWVIAVLYIADLGYSLGKHGQPRTGTHSFWWTLCCTAIAIGVLAAGGFWRRQ